MYSVWRKNRDGERLLGYAENQTIASLLIEADMEDSDESCVWMMRREETACGPTPHPPRLIRQASPDTFPTAEGKALIPLPLEGEGLYHEDEKQYSGLLEED